MADSAEKMRDTILNIITNNYEIVWGGIDEEEILSAQSIYKMTDMIVAALSASGTKSDGGVEGHATAFVQPRGIKPEVAPGPSDPIPSSPSNKRKPTPPPKSNAFAHWRPAEPLPEPPSEETK